VKAANGELLGFADDGTMDRACQTDERDPLVPWEPTTIPIALLLPGDSPRSTGVHQADSVRPIRSRPERSRQPAVDPAPVLEKLVRDPALRDRPGGRLLLRLLQQQCQYHSAIAGSHGRGAAAQRGSDRGPPRQCAEAWTGFARELDDRFRTAARSGLRTVPELPDTLPMFFSLPSKNSSPKSRSESHRSPNRECLSGLAFKRRAAMFLEPRDRFSDDCHTRVVGPTDLTADPCAPARER
jgi:hypothetical protein